MRITFVIPFIALTGGIKVPMEYGNQLHDMGHDVTFVYPKESPYPKAISGKGLDMKESLGKLKAEIRFWISRFLNKSELRWFDLRARLIRVPDLSEEYIPDGDIIMAVDWTTAEWINSYKKGKGKKFYLIQHYEIWSGPKDRVDATWRMPLNKVVISSWLKDIAEKNFGQQVFGPLIHGVDFEQFYNNRKIYNKDKRIGMLYHDLDWKGIPDGIQAFEIARETFPSIQLVMFGLKRGHNVPEYVEFHENPLREELRQIYCSCDIFVSPSWTEGCQLPPMEAMACQCAVVATNVGGIPDYTIPGETALVSPPRKPHALAQNLIRLLEDEEGLRRISLAGYQKIREFTWEKAAKQLEFFFQAA